ncbi:MAG: trypsin-like peptidase domain-containing protein [Candidatus Acidiferrales bacterium]
MEIHSKCCIRTAFATVANCLVSAVCFAQVAPQISAAAIYEHAHSSVVVVIVSDRDSKPVGQGSGFIVAKNRIVTNHHVVEGAGAASVVFSDGTSELVEGVASDSPARDLAILAVKTGARLPLKLGDELSARQGDSVYALGAPRGRVPHPSLLRVRVLTLVFPCSPCSRLHRSTRPIAVHPSILAVPCLLLNQSVLACYLLPCISNLILPEARSLCPGLGCGMLPLHPE